MMKHRIDKTKNTPTDGRYTLYSKIISLMGIKLDSTERVIKNQKVPNAIIRRCGEERLDRYRRYIPEQTIVRRSKNDRNTSILKKVVNTG
jgi:hypothetical protein